MFFEGKKRFISNKVVTGKTKDKIRQWDCNLSKRFRSSFRVSVTLTGSFFSFLAIIGFSLCDYFDSSFYLRIIVVLGIYLAAFFFTYWGIFYYYRYRNSIGLNIGQTPVSISYGDIFKTQGWKVIGCDSHYDTRVDDIVISKKSLHGQLFLNHGNIDEIKKAIEDKAKSLGLHKIDDGLYNFPLGTIIRYNSSVDKNTYLLLAMTKLDKNNDARIELDEFEKMLKKMWTEINNVYASNDIVLPILGSGITRFGKGSLNNETLIRFILHTLDISGLDFNATVRVVISGNRKEIQLYEFKDRFYILRRR